MVFGVLCFVVIELLMCGVGVMEVWCVLLVVVFVVVVLVVIEWCVCYLMVLFVWFCNCVFVVMNLMGSFVYVGYFGLLFVLSLYLYGCFGMSVW